MPSQDPKIVEISNLKKKVLEIETQLREEKKISLRLREASEKKIEQVNVVDSEITAEMERFRWKKEEILFQMNSVENELKEKVNGLKSKAKDLVSDIADYDIQTVENQRLQAKLKALSQEYQQAVTEQVEERNQRAQKNFDTRMSMEEIMRKMLKNVDSSYENDAISRMKLEASQAHIENERIHKEFDIREAKTEALIRQQQQSYDLLMKLRIELDMMTISTEIQEKNILEFIKQNQKTEKDLISASARVQQLRDQVLALDIAYRGKLSLEQEIKIIRSQSINLFKQSQKYRKMSVQLANKILSECVVIGDKSRMQLSKQITQQLSELSTNVETKPFTPKNRRSCSSKDSFGFNVDVMEMPIGLEDTNFDSIWKKSNNNTFPKGLPKQTSSFSMMFSGS